MKESAIVTTYFWRNLECELCKSPYPYETKTIDEFAPVTLVIIEPLSC